MIYKSSENMLKTYNMSILNINTETVNEMNTFQRNKITAEQSAFMFQTWYSKIYLNVIFNEIKIRIYL